jgi:hypothetical protein
LQREGASLIVNSNKPFGQWCEAFGETSWRLPQSTLSSTTPKSSPQALWALGPQDA